MKLIKHRSLRSEELAVIKSVLERAPLGESCDASRSCVEALHVVGECNCGCDSLFFSGSSGSTPNFRIADGLGYTADGEEIGIILWASGSQIVYLELYNYSELPPRLPLPETICPFEGSCRMRQ
jgi:hypothetical protein